MTETEMEISSDSLDGNDDDTELFLKNLDRVRRNWMEEIKNSGEALKRELQPASREYHNVTEYFHQHGIANMEHGMAKAIRKMQELRETFFSMSITPEEEATYRELCDILPKIEQQFENKSREKIRLTERRADQGQQEQRNLADVREKTVEKEREAEKAEAIVKAAFKVFGITMEHGSGSPGHLQVEFCKLTTRPGIDAGVVLDFDTSSPSLVRHWPQHPKLNELGHDLEEDGAEGVTNFLISARSFLKEKCQQVDQALQ